MSTELLEQFSVFKKNIENEVKGAVRGVDEIRALLNHPGGGGSPEADTITPGAIVTKNVEFLEGVKRHKTGRLNVGQLFPTSQKTVISSTAVGSSTPGVLSPERLPGITPLARRRLRIRDLFQVFPATMSSVDYIRQNGFTNAAYPQTEASNKGESAMTFTVGSAPCKTIAHWIPATNQVLDDLPELQRFINAELMYGLKLREEIEILRGDGTGDHLTGLLVVAGTYAGTYAGSGDTVADKLRHAILEMADVDEYPTGMVLSPKDWHDTELVKANTGGANTGEYILADPLGPPITVPTLWGLPVVVSGTLPPGQFLLGDFLNGAQIRDRMDATIDISTEHSDFFIKNQVAIRCEERIALPIFRTTSFMRGSF